MAKKNPEPTQHPRERAFLIGVDFREASSLLSMEDSLVELALLAETAGLDVVGEAKQRMDKPNASTLVGSGKVEEIKALVEETLADLVIFDTELSPRHQRELEEKLYPPVRVIDRTALILDIFAQHARTHEGSLQVELAQYEYRLPRLTRAWTHLARQAGGGAGRTGNVGGVGLRGPGETQLEVDRREVRRRITILKTELEKVSAHRMRYRAKRKKSQIPILALVGYTNAGKSTLLNYLSKANIFVADKLFATLDPTTRRISLPNGHSCLLTDTVGFIQKLPTQLVASFHATLEEISEADLLIHVVDTNHPNALAQWRAVEQTLEKINASKIPIITVMNKIDILPNQATVLSAVNLIDSAVSISAKTGQGIPKLLQTIERHLFETYTPLIVRLPYQQGQLISLFHEQGQIDRIEHSRGNVLIKGSIPGRLLASFQSFIEQTNHPQEINNEKMDTQDT